MLVYVAPKDPPPDPEKYNTNESASDPPCCVVCIDAVKDCASADHSGAPTVPRPDTD